MNYMTPQVSPRMCVPAKRSTVLKSLLAMLCVLFLAAQIQGLNHAHDGDLNLKTDCDICLKLSSSDDVLIVPATEFPAQLSRQTVAQYASASLVVESVKFHQARAPPIA